METISKLISRKKIAKDLKQYQKENICKYASNKCKSCTFKVETGCAYNLVVDVLYNNLSFDRGKSDKQWKEIMGIK